MTHLPFRISAAKLRSADLKWSASVYLESNVKIFIYLEDEKNLAKNGKFKKIVKNDCIINLCIRYLVFDKLKNNFSIGHFKIGLYDIYI